MQKIYFTKLTHVNYAFALVDDNTYLPYIEEYARGSVHCLFDEIARQGMKLSAGAAPTYTADSKTLVPLRDVTNLVGGSVKYDNSGYIIVSSDAIDDAAIPGYIAAYDAK